MLSEVFATVSPTAPPLASTMALSCNTACVSVFETFNASEPATPTLALEAPDVALAPKLCFESIVVVISASAVTPSALTVAPSFTDARLVIVATLIAAAAPIAAPDPAAEPSAVALASMSLDVLRANEPPPATSSSAVMVTVPGISAIAKLVDTLIARAAATPNPRLAEGNTAMQTLFQFDISLPDVRVVNVGGRVHVRFSHGLEPIARQLYRSARQMLLRRFGV